MTASLGSSVDILTHQSYMLSVKASVQGRRAEGKYMAYVYAIGQPYLCPTGHNLGATAIFPC
eukprot:1141220-Pelagomonas_calceolata.AAC.3